MPRQHGRPPSRAALETVDDAASRQLNELVQRHSDALDVVVAPFLDDPRVELVVGLGVCFSDALLRVVERHKSALADRLREWIRAVLFEYRLRCADPEEGGERAGVWLCRELGTGPPRRSQSEADDERIVRLDHELHIRLAPVFARSYASSAARNTDARPIVERVFGERVADLPRTDRLASFVARLLQGQGYSIERRSKAAARYRGREADALALYTERRYRIALRADDETLAGVRLKRMGLLNELERLRTYIAGVRALRRPKRKAQ